MFKQTINSSSGSGFKDPLSWLMQESQLMQLNEEGDDADVDANADTDAGNDADADADAGNDADADTDADADADILKPFANLELKQAFCWGWCVRSAQLCWANIADGSVTKGWKNSDIKRLDIDLKKNVDACYFFTCQGKFEDLDTGYIWRAAFIADHALWKLELSDGQPEVLPDDAKNFFSSEYFKKFAKRCGDLIDRAYRIYYNVVDQHLKNAELLSVDPIKLDKILQYVSNKHFMSNLRECKYELQ